MVLCATNTNLQQIILMPTKQFISTITSASVSACSCAAVSFSLISSIRTRFWLRSRSKRFILKQQYHQSNHWCSIVCRALHPSTCRPCANQSPRISAVILYVQLFVETRLFLPQERRVTIPAALLWPVRQHGTLYRRHCVTTHLQRHLSAANSSHSCSVEHTPHQHTCDCFSNVGAGEHNYTVHQQHHYDNECHCHYQHHNHCYHCNYHHQDQERHPVISPCSIVHIINYPQIHKHFTIYEITETVT